MYSLEKTEVIPFKNLFLFLRHFQSQVFSVRECMCARLRYSLQLFLVLYLVENLQFGDVFHPIVAEKTSHPLASQMGASFFYQFLLLYTFLCTLCLQIPEPTS